MDKNGVFGPIKGIFRPEKSAKIDFSLKLHFLHLSVKFRQKIVKNYKNMAENDIFGQKSQNFDVEKNVKK